MRSKIIVTLILTSFLFIMSACSKSANGTYIGSPDLPLVSGEKVTLTIKDSEGSFKLKASMLGFEDTTTSKIKVNQKEKTITIVPENTKLTYELENGNIKIVKDSTDTMTDFVFKKKK